MIGEDPGHGHLDGELDPATHGELQKELSEPQLGEVTALLQGLLREERGDGRRLHQSPLPKAVRGLRLVMIFIVC